MIFSGGMALVKWQDYHLVGIAGVGMSALAGALLDAGCAVSGSDRHYDGGQNAAVIGKLKAGGARLFAQDSSGLTSRTQVVVVSTAIEPDNPDLQAAARLGIPTAHRADVLAQFLDGRCSVAISGTSGKSTVTGMLGWILDCAGYDPLVINGAPVVNWTTPTRLGNVRAGQGGYCVVEADESDRSLLALTPDWCVVTNASRDHFNMEETLALFDRFTARARHGAISWAHTPMTLDDLHVSGTRSGVHFQYGDLPCQLRLLGEHNAQNAVVAMRAAAALGIAPAVSREALARFDGIERRLQRIGNVGVVDVFDDYGHNPAKIAAAFGALAPFYERLDVIWRPHGYGPLRTMFADLVPMFVQSCRPADRLWILPVYDAGGTAQRDVSSDLLVAALAREGVAAQLVGSLDAALEAVAGDSEAGAMPSRAVVTMGARDPELPILAARIVAQLGRG